MLNLLKAVLIGAPLALAAGPALAGQWAVDLGRCPDHLEDIRDRFESRADQRRDVSRADVREDVRDRRESRRDERVTNCPSSSLVFLPRAPGRAEAWRRPNRVKLVRRGGGFARVLPNGRVVAVQTIPPTARQLERLRREGVARARRNDRIERRESVRREERRDRRREVGEEWNGERREARDDLSGFTRRQRNLILYGDADGPQ